MRRYYEPSRMAAIGTDGFVVLHRKTHSQDFFGFTPTSKELRFPVGTEMINFVNEFVGVFVNQIQVSSWNFITVSAEVYFHIGNVFTDADR